MTVIGSRCKDAVLYLLLYVAAVGERWRRFSRELASLAAVPFLPCA